MYDPPTPTQRHSFFLQADVAGLVNNRGSDERE